MKKFFCFGLGLLSFTAIAMPIKAQMAMPVLPAVKGAKSIALQQYKLQQYALDLQQKLVIVQKKLLQLQLESMSGKNSKHQSLINWVKAKKLPKNIFVAGYGKNGTVHICQAKYKSQSYPGQLFKKGCLISYAGKSFFEKDYKVLAGDQPTQWKRFYYPSNSVNQSYPIIGGYENGKAVRICRVLYKDSIHVGKVVTNACDIGIGGKELRQNNFETLVSA